MAMPSPSMPSPQNKLNGTRQITALSCQLHIAAKISTPGVNQTIQALQAGPPSDIEHVSKLTLYKYTLAFPCGTPPCLFPFGYLVGFFDALALLLSGTPKIRESFDKTCGLGIALPLSYSWMIFGFSFAAWANWAWVIFFAIRAC